MDRLPLADEFPYEFLEPKISPFWLWVGHQYGWHIRLRKLQKVQSIEVDGMDRLKAMVGKGDGVLFAPNHCDPADAAVMLEVSRRSKTPFNFMAAYQIFRGSAGLARFLLPRVGAFPVDREGSDLRAFRTGVEILGGGKNPLVIFPEGEIYHTSDRLTPIREGTAVIATSAAKRTAERGKTVYLVPVGIKYRFLDGEDPLPTIHTMMDQLESRFTWWKRGSHLLIERIYAFADALLGLKELEYLGGAQSGPLKPRIATLRDAILDFLEDKHCGKRRVDTVPVRAKELRHVCLEKLAKPEITANEVELLRRDLNDIFVAIQLFSYPGDYLQADASVERISETVRKFEQDILGIEPIPHANRKAVVKIGEPIDVRERMAAYAKPRLAAGAITTELETKIQELLDSLGPGRPYSAQSKETTEPLRPRLQTCELTPLVGS